MIQIKPGTPELVEKLISELPEFTTKTGADEISERIASRDSHILLAIFGSAMAGFLVAYKEEDGIYYNWMMGVLPKFRKSGIGRKLMEVFERLAQAEGFRTVRVRTMNRYRGMLMLLVSRGYEITKYESGKITFERKLE